MHRLCQRLSGASRPAVFVVVLIIISLLAAVPAQAQETGRASATGSDSFSLNGREYQLFGIDGLEFNQSCFVDGQPLACGASAVRAFQTLLDPAPITCTANGVSPSGLALATCTGVDGDIALRMVEQGWAFAGSSASTDYVAAEDAARAAGAGAWGGKFLPPTAYGHQIAAIEASYARLAADAARTELEDTLTTGKLDLRGLEQVVADPAASATGATLFEEHEVSFGSFRPGFIDAAIVPPEIFTWKGVARALEATRQEGVAAVEDSVVGVIWEALAARPSQTVDTRNADGYYAALKDSSAGWITAGRQPILFVMAPDRPNWIRDWFAGQPPAGAKVSRRDDLSDPNYLGTIDGVDVYVGPGRERASLLVPSDILAGITYRRDAEGKALAMQVDAPGNEWVVRFGMALSWRDDQVTWLAFPQMAAPTPDAG